MPPAEKTIFFAKMGGTLPVGRVGQLDEIAQGLISLVRNEYTTGAVLDLDGGGRLH